MGGAQARQVEAEDLPEADAEEQEASDAQERAAPGQAEVEQGDRLDFAESRLDALGLDWDEFGGGNLGILVRSRWVVCAQVPAPGKRATKVRLVVDRWCD